MTDRIKAVPSEDLVLTPANEWRAKTWLVQLPSGRVCRVRTVSLVQAIARGDVPNALIPMVTEMMDGKRSMAELDPEELAGLMDVMVWLAKRVTLYPQIVDDDPQADDEVSIDAVSDADLMALGQFAINGGLDVFAGFREES